MMLPLEGDGGPEFITPPEINAKRPAWLDGSREMAFNRGQSSIWTIELDTGEIGPFLRESPEDLPAFVHPCAWPGERAVVVVGFRETRVGREGILYKLRPDTAEPILKLTNFPEVCAGRPGVSPDGQFVVFAGNAGRFAQGANQLWVVTLNGSLRRLEDGEPVLTQGRSPRWSPDGNWIACTSTRPAPNPDETTPRAVWIISADGTQAQQLTDHSMNPLHVAWSPDQKKLACGGVGCGLAIIDLPKCFQAEVTDGR